MEKLVNQIKDMIKELNPTDEVLDAGINMRQDGIVDIHIAFKQNLVVTNKIKDPVVNLQDMTRRIWASQGIPIGRAKETCGLYYSGEHGLWDDSLNSESRLVQPTPREM